MRLIFASIIAVVCIATSTVNSFGASAPLPDDRSTVGRTAFYEKMVKEYGELNAEREKAEKEAKRKDLVGHDLLIGINDKLKQGLGNLYESVRNTTATEAEWEIIADWLIQKVAFDMTDPVSHLKTRFIQNNMEKSSLTGAAKDNHVVFMLAWLELVKSLSKEEIEEKNLKAEGKHKKGAEILLSYAYKRLAQKMKLAETKKAVVSDIFIRVEHLFSFSSGNTVSALVFSLSGRPREEKKSWIISDKNSPILEFEKEVLFTSTTKTPSTPAPTASPRPPVVPPVTGSLGAAGAPGQRKEEEQKKKSAVTAAAGVKGEVSGNAMGLKYSYLDFGLGERIEKWGPSAEVVIPHVNVLHPYSIKSMNDDYELFPENDPKYLSGVRIDDVSVNKLPEPIRKALNGKKVVFSLDVQSISADTKVYEKIRNKTANQADLNLYLQEGLQLLRPHYFLMPKTHRFVKEEGYSQATEIHVGIYQPKGDLVFVPTADPKHLTQSNVFKLFDAKPEFHTGIAVGDEFPMVVSPSTMGVAGIDPKKTCAFYSVMYRKVKPNEVFVTLHVMLNPGDTEKVEKAVKAAPANIDLTTWLGTLAGLKLSNNDMQTEIKTIFGMK